MNNKPTNERLAKILSETQAVINDCNARCVDGSVEVNARLFEAMLLELQHRRSAESVQKPVAWTDEQELRDVEKHGCGYLFTVNPITPNADPRRVIKLYAAPQPAAELQERRSADAEFVPVADVVPWSHPNSPCTWDIRWRPSAGELPLGPLYTLKPPVKTRPE